MSAAAKTPTIVDSSASSSAKYVGTDRLIRSGPRSASCHEARMTSGTRTAISASITSAMPSTSNVNRASQVGIQRYDSRNWNRGPPGLNATHMTTVSANTASDQPSATRLTSSGRPLGSRATTAAPAAGATVRTDRYGKELIRASPP